MAGLSWALWLAAPAVITVLAALFLWWRGRPPRPLTTRQTISGHRAYLDALAPRGGGRDHSSESLDRRG